MKQNAPCKYDIVGSFLSLNSYKRQVRIKKTKRLTERTDEN